MKGHHTETGEDSSELSAPACSFCSPDRKLKLESELAAQLWRVSWDDVQISNLDKVLRRTCSRLTMSLVTSTVNTTQ